MLSTDDDLLLDGTNEEDDDDDDDEDDDISDEDLEDDSKYDLMAAMGGILVKNLSFILLVKFNLHFIYNL